jgi:hypothetical protein
MHATHTRPALIHSVEPAVRGWPRIPLMGLAEASVLRAMRDHHVDMREISAAVQFLREQGGEFALGSPDLVTDGVSALLAHENGLETLRGGQGVLLATVRENLQPFTLAPDGSSGRTSFRNSGASRSIVDSRPAVCASRALACRCLP